MSGRCWDPKLETLPRAELARLQRHRLSWQLRRCWDGSAFYRERLAAAGLDPAAFAEPAVLARLPVLTIDELLAEAQAMPPFGRLTVAPEAWWVEMDDDLPAPRRVWTDGDVSHRADLAARALWAASGGLASQSAVDVQIMAGEQADPRAVAAVRDGLARVASLAGPGDARSDVPMVWTAQLSLDVPMPRGARRVFGHPLVGPTLAYECGHGRWLHWAEDHFLVEVVDLATGTARPAGEDGDVLITELTREGSPLIRVATGLTAALDETPCPCGRTSVRSHAVTQTGLDQARTS